MRGFGEMLEVGCTFGGIVELPVDGDDDDPFCDLALLQDGSSGKNAYRPNTKLFLIDHVCH